MRSPLRKDIWSKHAKLQKEELREMGTSTSCHLVPTGMGGLPWVVQEWVGEHLRSQAEVF